MARILTERFTGRIAGFGTSEGPRIVIGMWDASPFGRFADVMIEHPDARRQLLAPTAQIADYVSSVYTFDEVEVTEVRWSRAAGGLHVDAGELSVTLRVGALTRLGRVLRAVPQPLATSSVWLTAVDPVAAALVPGAHTSGATGAEETGVDETRTQRREYYGVRAIRSLDAVDAHWSGLSLGGMAALDPPVTFGFGSAPAAPSLVDLTTVIRTAHPARHAR